MILIMPQSEGRLVGIKATGRIGPDDFQNVMPHIIEVLENHSPIKMLLDWTNCDGFTPDAESDRFGFLISYGSNIEKVAIVGDTKWRKLANEVIDAVRFELRIFNSTEMQAAWDWLETA